MRLTWITAILLALSAGCSAASGDSSPTVTSADVATNNATVQRPAAPQNIEVATPYDFDGAAVYWQHESDADTEIQIERASSLDGPWESVGTVSGTARPELWNPGLCAGDRFWYRLAAVRDGISSPYSEPASGIAGEQMPGLPTAETCIEGA